MTASGTRRSADNAEAAACSGASEGDSRDAGQLMAPIDLWIAEELRPAEEE